MSTPSDKGATLDTGDQGKASQTFEMQVNEVVGNTKRSEETGKYVFADGLSEELQYAATSELRRRDTQASFTKTSQQSKVVQAENAALRDRLKKATTTHFSEEQTAELDTLKYENPEAWRAKLNELEQQAQTALSEEFVQVTAEAGKTGELEARKDVLDTFIQENPGFAINDDVIANDVPPRITKKLEDGTISFHQFLVDVKDYLSTGKVVTGSEASNLPNMSGVGGGSQASQAAVAADAETSYATELY